MTVACVVFAAFGLAGLAMLIGGVALPVRRLRFLRRAVRTAGSVVRLEKARSEPGDGPRHRLTIAFTGPNGSEVTFTESRGGEPRLGQEIRVLYDPADPRRARVEYGAGSAFLAGGILLVIGALWTLAVLLAWPSSC